MRRFRHLAPRGSVSFPIACSFVVLISIAVASPFRKKEAEIIRWDEGRTGCTFTQSDDGKYLYGMWTNDVGVTLSVDAQEIEKIRRRHEQFFSLQLRVVYRGKNELDVPTQNISLEFTDHFKVVQTALDPDAFSESVQNDADELDHETAREVEKHPEKKEAKETYMRAFQKDAAELIEFITKNSLRPTRLDAGNTETAGWIFFSTSNKWLGGWKKQEAFVLRFPLDGKILEFPFKLPPKEGELLLRKRE